MSNVEVEQINNKITELRRRRMPISVKHYLMKERYLRGLSKEEKAEVENLEIELQKIDNELAPLLKRFEELNYMYGILYEGELSDIYGNTHWETHSELHYFKTHCEIDTLSKGWDLTIPNIDELLDEIYKRIYYSKYSNFRILNIKYLGKYPTK